MSLWRPPPRLTVSEWADQYRHLSSEASAEPGRWSTARAEYQRGIMDAISDQGIPEVVVTKSAQVGWTEILGNVAAYHIHQDPAPMLVLQPTLQMGEAWSKDRLAPMLRDSPALRGLVGDARSRDGGNTLLHKTFPGGHLTIAGANSPASLASRPIRILLCDEVDRYPPSAGAEGDPISLARKRTTTFFNKKILIGGTPTITGASRVETEWERSDKRRFWIRCPHCEGDQTLVWEQVRWTDDDPETAAYHCAECGAAWTDVERWAAVSRGEWRAELPFAGIAGFHISELYSPWRRIEDTVTDFLAAKGKPETLKVWRNTALGLSWAEQGEAPDWERLVERQETLQAGTVPAWAVVLTAGVDNQAAPERLEIAVWAWGPGYRSTLIHAEQIDGSPAADEPWDRVKAILDQDWPQDGGGTMRIAQAAADTGGQHTGVNTAGVYAQLRRLRTSVLLAVKGVSGWAKAAPLNGPTLVDVSVRGGRKIPKGLKLWTVAVDVFKAEFYGQLWLTVGEDGSYPAGWVHLPDWLNIEQVKQLVAEQLVTVKDRRGFAKREWQKMRANEQLDMRVYARAALSALGSDAQGDRFWDRMRKRLAKDVEMVAPAQPADQPAPGPTEMAPAMPTNSEPPIPAAPAPPRRTSRWRY